MQPVDPGARQIGERRYVCFAREPFRLEAAHLAGRGCRPVHALPADNGTHRQIAGEPFGVVDVLISSKAAVHSLAQEAHQLVPNVRLAPPVAEGCGGHRSQGQSVVQIAIGEQDAVRDPAARSISMRILKSGP